MSNFHEPGVRFLLPVEGQAVALVCDDDPAVVGAGFEAEKTTGDAVDAATVIAYRALVIEVFPAVVKKVRKLAGVLGRA